jgi:TolA-binding protein
MFAEATARRSQSDLRTAEALYRELTRRFPESDEALLSHGILGRLFFDTERYLEALKEFEAVVGGRHQDLAEDALAHQAMTLEALHRTTEARETWERLLQRFPASLYSRRANERLRSLPTP